MAGQNALNCSRSCANRSRAGIKYSKGGNWSNKSTRLRNKLIEERGPRCERCGYSEYVEILNSHHVVRVADGGGDESSNLLLVCPNCHAVEHLMVRMEGKLKASSET